MKLILSILYCLISILVYAHPLNAEVYSWTDENGIRHFSNTNIAQEADNYSLKPEIKCIIKEEGISDDPPGDTPKDTTTDTPENTPEYQADQQEAEVKEDVQPAHKTPPVQLLTKDDLDTLEKDCICREKDKWMREHEVEFLGNTPDIDYIQKTRKRNLEFAEIYAKKVCHEQRLTMEQNSTANKPEQTAAQYQLPSSKE